MARVCGRGYGRECGRKTALGDVRTEEPLYSGHHWDLAGCPV